MVVETEAVSPAVRKLGLGGIALWTASALIGINIFGAGLYLTEVGVVDLVVQVGVNAIFGAIVGLLAGLPMGILQRVALPRRLVWARSWVWATALGSAVGGAVAEPLLEAVRVAFPAVPVILAYGVEIVGPALWGGGMGLGQFVLVRKHVPWSGWWVAIAAGCWAVATMLAFVVPTVPNTNWDNSLLINYARLFLPATLIAGTLPALALRWLLSRATSATRESHETLAGDAL